MIVYQQVENELKNKLNEETTKKFLNYDNDEEYGNESNNEINRNNNNSPILIGPQILITDENSASHVDNSSDDSDRPPRLILSQISVTDEVDADLCVHVKQSEFGTISCDEDKFYGSIAGHGNELVYFQFDNITKKAHLTVVPGIQNTDQIRTYDFQQFVRDMEYSTVLDCYLCATAAKYKCRLFKFYSQTGYTVEWINFTEFRPQHRNEILKRIFCTKNRIYLIFWNEGRTDELVLLDYNKNKIDCKLINDLIQDENCEISDISGPDNDKQLALAYRDKQKFGIYIYQCLNSIWLRIKKVYLDEIDDTPYFSPRLCWLNQLDLYSIIDFKSGDMIMMNCKGDLKGKRSFICYLNVDRPEISPINVCSPKNKNWLAIRYEKLISIHQLID
ncbi:unnamed protein product [Didymodactylos carnosus]|nr:unnamed protein product [Didymodactylos carnosus]CAF4187193.1 unnamed protein product [Didymodactylos carnosus]